jgi:DNA-binding HxlR family transcriptional regulator
MRVPELTEARDASTPPNEPALGAAEANGSDLARPPGARKERILEALGDRWCREILRMLNEVPRSAQEILASNGIPASTLYRKLHELTDIGLIGIQRSMISSDGKRVELYRSRLDELRVEVRGAGLRIDVRLRDLAAERLKEMWRNLRPDPSRS